MHHSLNYCSATESERLNYQADALRELVGGKVPQTNLTLPPNARILDIGCGTGAVTRDIAHEYPSAKVLGVDISLQTKGGKPENVEFVQGNVLDLAGHDERFKYGSFDFVFHRLLICGMTNWHKYMETVALLLKPGAPCEFHEYHWEYRSPNDELIGEDIKVIQSYRSAAKAKGFDLAVGNTIAEYTLHAGLTDIEQKTYKSTSSTWMAETNPETLRIGLLNRETFKPFHHHVMKRVFEGMGYTEEEISSFQEDISRFLDETEDRRYTPFVVTTARKPD